MPSFPFPAEPWKIIRLQGSDREMGRQHAEQVGDAARRGMPLFYHGLMARMLDRRPNDWMDRVTLSTIKKLLDPVLVNRLLRQVPRSARDRLEGLAEAAGLQKRELEIALVLPDLLPLLTGLLSRAFPGRFVEGMPEVRLGCSSFISAGDRFLVSRNLDFPGVAYWDRYPVMQVVTPQTGLRSLSFSTAGVALGGITGVNEAQVFVALHQHYSRTISVSGELPFMVGQRILNEARTLDEALGILSQSRLTSSWAFVLADGKTRQGAIWETTPRVHGCRRLSPKDRVLAHSNFFQTPECQPTEYAMSERMNWDNYYRKTRLDQLVHAAGGEMTPALAAKAISDHFDPFWNEEKIVNRIVSQAFNIQSVVIDPENMHAWLATGDSPIHLAGFQKWDLGEIFRGGEGRTSETLPGFRFQKPAQDQAKREFVESLVYAMDGDEPQALEKIEASLHVFFTPEVALTASVVAMKQGALEKAETYLTRAVDTVEAMLRDRPGTPYPPEYFEMRLYQGRLCDLQGKRATAQKHYTYLVESKACTDANLKRLARSRSPYTRKKLDQMMLPYSTYAPFT